MPGKYADLHVHSIYSDGTYSPEEIVREAVQNEVGLLAVCDHNVIEGSLKTEPLARAAGIRFVRGVEIDSMLLGEDTHILCYGADFSNGPLLSAIRHARARLDWMSDELLNRMLPDYPQLSAEAYAAFPMDSALGGWKLLQYLYRAGVTDSLRGGFRFYDDYDVTYASAGFQSAAEIIARIHEANGLAVLAHPGVTFSAESMDRGLAAALECGIDGIECYYPKHAPELRDALLKFCAAHALQITAGSDCHGAFSTAQVGGVGGADSQLLPHLVTTILSRFPTQNPSSTE